MQLSRSLCYHFVGLSDTPKARPSVTWVRAGLGPSGLAARYLVASIRPYLGPASRFYLCARSAKLRSACPVSGGCLDREGDCGVGLGGFVRRCHDSSMHQRASPRKDYLRVGCRFFGPDLISRNAEDFDQCSRSSRRRAPALASDFCKMLSRYSVSLGPIRTPTVIWPRLRRSDAEMVGPEVDLGILRA